jgi:hypothetical protein
MTMPWFSGTAWAGGLRLLLLLTVLAAGCRRSPLEEQAEVSGTVFYKGKPLPGGQITFANSRGHTSVAVIDPRGHYQCPAPVGEVQIAVENRMLERQTSDLPMAVPERAPKPQGESIRGTYVPLPQKYHALETSGLKYTVTDKPQTHDVLLE